MAGAERSWRQLLGEGARSRPAAEGRSSRGPFGGETIGWAPSKEADSAKNGGSLGGPNKEAGSGA